MKPILALILLCLLSGCVNQSRIDGCESSENNVRCNAAIPSATVSSGFQIGGHLVNSFTLEIVRRPVIATRDLVALATHTGIGLVRDLVIDGLLLPGLAGKSAPALNAGPGMDLLAWEQQLDKLTGTRLQSGKIKLHIGGEQFFQRLRQAVTNAEESVKIRTYIFDNDDVALAVADQLKQRSRDIDVAVLVDGIGTLSGGLAESDSLPEGHRAPTSILDYLRRDSQVRARMLPNTWLMGDHSKTFIIDDRVAFLGGMNIGREYRYDWHDMMVELQGPVVAELVGEHRRAWSHSGIFGDLALLRHAMTAAAGKRKGQGPPSLRLLYTRPHDPQIYRAQLAAIRSARQYIYIENAYFSDDRILYELVRARHRGVDVRVILPSRGDNGPMDHSNLVAANRLLEHGIAVYQFPGMSHIKAAVIDGWACFGSANFDKLSLKLNAEINIATSDSAVVNRLLEEVFRPDFARSMQLDSQRQLAVRDHVYELLADVLF